MPGTSRRDSRGPHNSSSSPQVDQFENAALFDGTIEAVVDLVNDPDEIQTETRDPNDDYLIALARAHDVDAIVSGDEDLLEWEEQRPPVMTPAQFEDRGGTT